MKVYFEYLDSLRESGVISMFKAGPYLVDRFGITKKRASLILKEWMLFFRKDIANKEDIIRMISIVLWKFNPKPPRRAIYLRQF